MEETLLKIVFNNSILELSQINSFTNQNRIHTDSNIQLLSNKNTIKLIKTKINNSIKI